MEFYWIVWPQVPRRRKPRSRRCCFAALEALRYLPELRSAGRARVPVAAQSQKKGPAPLVAEPGS